MAENTSAQLQKTGWISIIVNVVLFILKYWVGVVSGSIAFMADAWHTLSDSISSVMLIIGLWMANRPADKDHPFGHGRAEWITAILIGAFLGYIGISFLMESIAQLRSGSRTEFGELAWIVLAISILGKEGLAQYAFYQGRKFKAKSVIADGWHHRSDALSSVIILLGLLIGKNFWWIDGVLGILVSLFIFYATWEILTDIFKTLLGEKPDEITQQRLKNLINDVSGRDLYLHHIHIHNYGNHKELTFHIRLPSHMSLQEAHAIASRIEKKINEEMEMQATIHMEPLPK